MAVKKWPTGPDYFNQTNVGAIVRDIEVVNGILGLSFPDQHQWEESPTSANNGISMMANYPALTRKVPLDSE